MKKLLQPLRWALPALLLTGFGANAQALNYAVAGATNTAGTFTDLGTTGTAIATANNDDANSTAQPIGFSFSYNGAAFTQFVLSTNGLIKLGATAPSAANLFLCNTAGCTTVSPVTSADPADVNLIMPFNFDLEPGTGGATSYRVLTSGTAPNRVCTVQWKNVKDKADATPANTQYDNFTFQAKLYETTNNIEFVYGPAVASTATAQSRFPVVGIKGSGSASGQTVLGSKTTGAAPWTATTFITGNYTGSTHNFRNASLPDAGRTYRFTPGTAGPATPPANDNCSGAIALTVSATCTPVTGDNTNATASPATVPAPACGGTTTTGDNDVWFRVVVPASGGVTVATSAVPGSTLNDTVLELFSGTCGSLTAIGCNDDAVGNYSSLTVSGQTPGATLYARVMSYGTTPSGTFGICATTPAAAATNDDPTTAIALPLNASCVPLNASNIGATTTTPNGYTNPPAAGCGIAVNPKDVWFTFRTNASGAGSTAATIQVTGNPAGMIRAFSAASSAGPFTEIGCAAGAGNNMVSAPLNLTTLTPNTVYYVFVSGYGSGDTMGAFTICATSTAAVICGDPTAAQIANVTATSAQITFTAGANNVSYNVTYTPQGGTATTVTPNPTTSPITINGLTASTTYTITIQSVCSAGMMGAVLSGTFTTLSGLPAPANDDPTGAVVLPVSTTCNPVNSTNVASTTTTPNGYTNPNPAAAGCGVAVNPKDVWFSFTATSAAATITVTGAPAGLLRAFSAASSAGPFTQVGCAAGTTNNTVSAPLALTGLTAGTVYYISVSGYGSGDTQGAFTICVTGAGPATCNPVTNLAATSTNNGTGANVTFTPAAGAVSYTVTYQIAGAAATTVTPNPTASPVVLSGLTPSRPYLVTVTTNCAAGQSSAASSTTFRTVLAAREALGNGSLSVFPNPAQSAFTLTLPALTGERTANVTLLNALGQAVYTRALELNAAGTQARVDVSALAKGIYTLQVKTSTQTATKSVVVE